MINSEKTNQVESESPAEFDAFKDDYSSGINDAISFSGQSHDFFTQVKADHFLDVIIPSLKSLPAEASENFKILDVGCGHGLIHPLLLSGLQQRNMKPFKITGVDMARSVVDVARINNPEVSYKSHDGARLPFEDNSFDCAFAICVMHHVPPQQWDEFMREMSRVVRPNGIVAIYEHNPLNPITQYIVRTCPIDENAVLLGAGKTKQFIKNNNMTEVKTDFILFTPFSHKLFRSFDRILKFLPFGAQYVSWGRVK